MSTLQTYNLKHPDASGNQITFTSGGLVGVGTSSPGYPLTIACNGNAQGVSLEGRAADDIGEFTFFENDGTTQLGRLQGRQSYFQISATDNTKGIFIDNSSNVGIGFTTPSAPFHISDPNHGIAAGYVGGTLPNSAGIYTSSSTSHGQAYGSLIVQARADFSGYGISFRASNQERMRIDGSGNVVLKPTNPDGVSGSYSNYLGFRVTQTNNQSALLGAVMGQGQSSWGGDLTFWRKSNNGSPNDAIQEGMRLRHHGGLLIGRTVDYNSGGEGLAVQAAKTVGVFFQSTNADYATLLLRNTYADYGGNNQTAYQIVFTDQGGTNTGSVTSNGSSTAFNTSSDYRLKENIVPLTGAIDRLNQLEVHRFNFIDHAETVVDGFIAHEAQAVVPECVTGSKDEVDGEGNPVYQGIDQSKLVPLLTAALQESIAKIETLEQRLSDAGIA